MLPLKLPWDTAQTRWKSQLDPVLASPLNQGILLPNVVLVSGVNVINHLLGKTPVGWYLVDIQSPVSIYRTAAFNPLTLTLTASGPVTVSLAVF